MEFYNNNKLIIWCLPILWLWCFLINNNGVEASHEVLLNYQSLTNATTHVDNFHKPAFHFRPKFNWINDPNGPMYYNGLYHLFYQYNPKGSVWGNIIWAHSVSKDLINWIPLEPAIYPTKPFDKYGCWSGSATILPGNKPIILYTGIIDINNTQVQNYAVPANLSDPYLREWVKPNNNPLIVAEPGMNKTSFRDPTTAWFKDGHWRILIGGRRKYRGISYLYRSRDFVKWTKARHPFHTVADSGNWECPDFFPVAIKGKKGLDNSVSGEEEVRHVHKVSLDSTRFDYYTIGRYYPNQKDKYVPDNTSVDGWKGLRFDYGNFYASKSFFDPSKNRRIVWGWANESDTIDDDNQKGWAGIQLIPRTIWLDPNGKQLVQWPVEELETLRGKNVHMCNNLLKKGDLVKVKGITAAQADVEVTFSFTSLDKAEEFNPSWANLDAQDVCSKKGSFVEGGVGPFGIATLASSEDLEEYTPVFFRIFKVGVDKHKVLMCSDATKSSLKKGLYNPSFAGFVDVDLTDKRISLRSLIDHSLVESFGAEGKTCISSRVYPTLAVNDKAQLFVFNNGTEPIKIESLDAWNMEKPRLMN